MTCDHIIYSVERERGGGGGACNFRGVQIVLISGSERNIGGGVSNLLGLTFTDL